MNNDIQKDNDRNGESERKPGPCDPVDPLVSLDLNILIDLLNDYTDGWYKMINNKPYNLITNSQLIKIIATYIKRKN